MFNVCMAGEASLQTLCAPPGVLAFFLTWSSVGSLALVPLNSLTGYGAMCQHPVSVQA